MRILHISTRLILGGSQENTVLSCEGQARRGHEVHLAFGPIYGPEGSLLRRVEAFNASLPPGVTPITTHVVPHLVREVRPLDDLRAKRELRTLVRRLRPDVVHTHSSKAGILGRLAAWSAFSPEPPPRVVHTIHGPPFMPVEGSWLARLRTRATNAAYAAAERVAARRCHALVSVADAMTTQFLARGIGTPAQYVTVRSGMDVAAFLDPAPGETRAKTRTSLTLAPDDVVIGTVARLAEHKGHDDLLDALAPDLRAHPRWKLLWVGDGWWRPRLIARAKSLGLGVHELDARAAPPPTGASILLTGLVPPERIPALVRAMDVLAHPSTREGLPRTVPQALLAGVCPVVYDVDGAREVCVEMRTGRLVPPRDLTALRDAIRWCAEHPDERAELAARGRDACRDAFSVDTMLDGLDRVYAGR